jgi:hypothetical protein
MITTSRVRIPSLLSSAFLCGVMLTIHTRQGEVKAARRGGPPWIVEGGRSRHDFRIDFLGRVG